LLCDLGVLCITEVAVFESSQRRRDLLRNYVIAECSLAVHDSKVVVVTVAEVRLRDDLVDFLSAFNCPDDAPAWFESESLHLPLVNELYGVLESVTEPFREFGFLRFRKLAGRHDVLAYGLDYFQLFVVCL